MIIYFNDSNNITKKYNLNFFSNDTNNNLYHRKVFKSIINTIYKENNLFQLFWAGFFFPKMPLIFNTNTIVRNR